MFKKVNPTRKKSPGPPGGMSKRINSRILSDVSKRVLIVKGIEKVEEIARINNDERIFKVEKMDKGIYKIELISRVGDYFRK